MTEETTTEQLVEIEGQAEDTPATGYTPPEGWRVVAVGEALREGDMWVWPTADQLRQTVHVGAVVGANQRYIRPIEPEPQPEPEVQPIQVREGRWRTRSGDIRDVIPTPNYDERATKHPWYDAKYDQAWQNNGRYFLDEENHRDLVEYLGPIEPQPEPVPEPAQALDADEQIRLLQQANDSQAETIGRLQAAIDERVDLDTADQTRAELQGRINDLETIRDNQAATIEELRSEVSYVQRLLGESRQRVTQLEELVASLRTINRGCENAVREAGNMNTALRNQLAAVKAELASVAADRQQLRVELDAAQQVPADSPEIRQLRADLAEVTQDRDTYRHAHELLVRDIDATHQRTKAMTVEAIAEWLVPVQAAIAAADNVAESTRAGWLAEAVIQHLPSIMRSLTGLVDEEPDPQLAPY